MGEKLVDRSPPYRATDLPIYREALYNTVRGQGDTKG
jgi:hypothetical protein